MDDLSKPTSQPLEMTEEKRKEIKEILIKEWDNYSDRPTLANAVMEGYIFGKYAQSEHYPIDLFTQIIAEIDAEKTPNE